MHEFLGVIEVLLLQELLIHQPGLLLIDAYGFQTGGEHLLVQRAVQLRGVALEVLGLLLGRLHLIIIIVLDASLVVVVVLETVLAGFIFHGLLVFVELDADAVLVVQQVLLLLEVLVLFGLEDEVLLGLVVVVPGLPLSVVELVLAAVFSRFYVDVDVDLVHQQASGSV